MELKYKIDRHNPSHIMPIMLLSFLHIYFFYFFLPYAIQTHIQFSIETEMVQQFFLFAFSTIMSEKEKERGREGDQSIKRQKESTLFFFPLRADCFLPLVQRDLWRICWLSIVLEHKSDSYLISICIFCSIYSYYLRLIRWTRVYHCSTLMLTHMMLGSHNFKLYVYTHTHTQSNTKAV